MSIICPKCKKKHASIYLSFICECGQNLGIEHEQIFHQLENICKDYKLKIEEKVLAQIRKIADKIVVMILDKKSTPSDIAFEKQKLKGLISGVYPGKMCVYDLIYEPRFKRFWQQFREDSKDRPKRS